MTAESRESIIEDLRDLGVRANDVLLCNPTDEQLAKMRDGLMSLYAAIKAAPRYLNSEEKVILVFGVLSDT
jgi:hypothetical protein